MKRLFITLLAVLVSVQLALGTMAGLFYYTLGEDAIPKPVLQVQGVSLTPQGHSWKEPVLGGIVFRQFTQALPQKPQSIGVLEEPLLSLTLPQGYDMAASISKDGSRLWQGTAEELANYFFLDNGSYEVQLNCRREADENNKGYGMLQYIFGFTVRVQPRCEVGTEFITQGDVFAIRLSNLSSSTVPVAETELGPVLFAHNHEGEMTGFIPVGFDTVPDTYAVKVKAGTQSWTWNVVVEAATATTKELKFDESEERLQLAKSEEALQELEETLPPLYPASDDYQYWEGRFVMPVEEGAVITRYGTLQYFNGTGPTRHDGVDIGAKMNSPVLAPNAGRVVFAGSLQNTGNTLVIDHGGGLKSYFFHLQKITARPGDAVSRSEQVGTVGITGYSTWPHLRYEARIGEVPINPVLLFNGAGAIYTFE